MTETRSAAIRQDPSAQPPAAVTAFVCVNCARPGRTPTSAGRPRPDVPDFGWPLAVRQVLVPCTGRIQPEHVLKAFESGADLVCAVGCQEDNCHHVEGSRRCARRVEHVRSILRDIGLSGERLLFFTLPGSAVQDLALGAGKTPSKTPDLTPLVAAVRDQVTAAVQNLSPSPLGKMPADEAAGDSLQQPDATDDDNED